MPPVVLPPYWLELSWRRLACSGERVVAELVHAGGRVGVALRDREILVGREVLFAALDRQRQHAERQRPVVLPGVLPLRRLERRRRRTHVCDTESSLPSPIGQDRRPASRRAVAAHDRPRLERRDRAVVEVRRARVELIVETVAQILGRHVLSACPRAARRCRPCSRWSSRRGRGCS